MIKSVDENGTLMETETPYVALDAVGAGVGDCVLVDWGGSMDNNMSMVGDMSIVGIVDMIEFE